MHIIINIGRNIDDTPMSELYWEEFIGLTRTSLVLATKGDPIAEYHGVSQWGDITEECASIQRWNVSSIDADKLRADLRKYAEQFGQDAIALTIAGASELIEP